MPTPVVMPQMGESIVEGTIVRWIKREGDTVERDEPLFEISTDKVDAEIPAPTAGVLSAIAVQEGETVPVGSVVATIRGAEEGDAAGESGAAGPAGGPELDEPPARVTADRPDIRVRKGTDGRAERTSPLVRRLAREHQLDLSQITGTGRGGRVTKRDVLGHLESAAPDRARSAAEAAGVDVVPMTPMRKTIAERMVLSRRTSAHVHTVFEVDFSRVSTLREAKRVEYERQDAKLTYLSFIAHVVVQAARQVPIINASLVEDGILYKREINLGIAVALEQGLIVPVIRGAENMDLPALSRAIADLAGRARSKRLSPEDVQDGTFTITNHGVSGGLFGMPIINQPQVAILGVGVVQKRPVVVEDEIVVRPMAYLTLGFDHRIIDGATAERFMSILKNGLENFAVE